MPGGRSSRGTWLEEWGVPVCVCEGGRVMQLIQLLGEPVIEEGVA